jgi:hypothetical protein
MEHLAPQPTYDELLAEVMRLRAEAVELAYCRAELAQWRRLTFGQKRKRFVPVSNASQLDIGFGELPLAKAPVKTQRIEYTRTKPSRH